MLSQVSETLKNVELKLNLPSVTVDSQECYSYALYGSDRQKAESCLEIF